MNDNAKKWVAALRSGRFEQCQDVLSRGGKHCCLGVACETYQEEVGELNINRQPHFPHTTYDGERSSLPRKVGAWLGINFRDGSYDGSSLARDNDNKKTFSEIADIIESEPRGLFVE